MSITPWILAVLTNINPPSVLVSYYKEDMKEVVERYNTIAQDLDKAIQEEGPIFSGKHGVYKTAALVLSIAKHESGFTKRVDTGRLRGDGGRSWCLMQINIGSGNVAFGSKEMQSWYGKDLVKDRVKCFRAGIYAIKASIKQCKSIGRGADAISWYTSGSCKRNEEGALMRWNYSLRILRNNSPS